MIKMKSLNNYIIEKLKLSKNSTYKEESFDVIGLLEEVMNLLLKKSWPNEIKEKVQDFGNDIVDYEDLRIIYTCGSIDETYEIESITPTYKLKQVGKDQYFKVREDIGKTNVIEFPNSYNNQLDEILEINKDNSILLYETGGEGNCIIIKANNITL